LAAFIGPVQAQAEELPIEGTDVNGEGQQSSGVMPSIEFSVLEDGRVRILALGVPRDRIKAFLFEGQDVTTVIEAFEKEGKLEIVSTMGEIRKGDEDPTPTPEDGTSTSTLEGEVIAYTPVVMMDVEIELERIDGGQFGFLLDNGISLTKTVDFEESRFGCGGLCIASLTLALPLMKGFIYAGDRWIWDTNSQTPPSGSYKDSCRNISVSGSTLKAECKDMRGSWHTTSISKNCSGDIANRNGALRCE